MSNDREVVDDIEHEATCFTKHGIVYCHCRPHNDRIFASKHKELNYFTYYAMIHNGRLWRRVSWGGGFGYHALNCRARKFARDVMRATQDEANFQPVSPAKQMERELAQTREALSNLVSLVQVWMDTAFPKMGMVWSRLEDYPSALRSAMNMLERTGGDGKERNDDDASI